MRILYGVPSEGMGHATRSKVIIQHLLERGHEVRIATSDRAFEMLEDAFPGRCLRIEGLHLKYERGGVDKSATFAHLLSSAPEGLATNVKQAVHLWRSEPLDLVISDFESFSYTFAKIASLPLLSIDNMQVINRCVLGIEIPDEETESYSLAKTIIKAKVPFCQRYLITSFFDAEPCKPNTELVPPILRDAVLDIAAERLPEASHILVYRTASGEDDFIESLRAVQGQHFVVYGLNRDELLGNVTLRRFSEAGFIRELATCRAVVANGGFSLISEAVFLHRPVCSFPLRGQFEQFVNGAEIERLGYGRRFGDFSADAVKAFLYDRDRFKERLEAYHQRGNQDVFAAVDRFIDDVDKGGLPEEE